MTITSMIATAILLVTIPAVIALFIWFLFGKEMPYLRAYRNTWLVLLAVSAVVLVMMGVVYIFDAAISGTWGFND